MRPSDPRQELPFIYGPFEDRSLRDFPIGHVQPNAAHVMPLPQSQCAILSVPGREDAPQPRMAWKTGDSPTNHDWERNGRAFPEDAWSAEAGVSAKGVAEDR